MSQVETKHNEKVEQDFDKIRNERRKQAFGLSDKSNEENLDKKLDNEENNDYIDDNDSENNEIEKFQSVIDKTFGGDPLKLAKSYLSSQSEFTKQRNQNQELQKQLQRYNEMIEHSPTLKKAVENAQSIEEIESLLTSQKEPEGKPIKPEEKSKLDVPYNVEPAELIAKGYINDQFFDNLSDIEKKAVIQRAEMKYFQDEFPKIVAQRSAEEYQKQIAEIEKQKIQRETQEKNKTLNLQRYEDGIISVVEKYGLDFASNEEHKKLLDEIDAEVIGIRDRENPDVIKPEAVEIATQLVLRRNNMLEDQTKKVAKEDMQLDNARQFNVNRRQERRSSEPTSIGEKLRQRKIERYEQQMSRGIPARKQEIIKNYK